MGNSCLKPFSDEPIKPVNANSNIGRVSGAMGEPIKPRIVQPAAAPPKFVAGLDFGTTFSGYAYSPMGTSLEYIGVCQSWPGQDEAHVLPSVKTTTSLLYEGLPNGEYRFWAWGWPARLLFVQESARFKERLAGRAPEDFASSKVAPMVGQPFLVEKFKLHLSDKPSGQPPLPPGLTVERCITDYLRELGRECFRQIKADYEVVNMDEIQWCLTVPAMWSNSAKEVMKQLAVQAGLKGPNNPHPVLIVLEPEAASIFTNHHGQAGKKVFDCYLVVDAGGGTVDVATHVTDPKTGKLKEVVSSAGELCGGWLVDEGFRAYLQKQPWFPDLLQSSTSLFALESALLELRQQFEMAKRTFDGESKGYVTLPRLMPPAVLERHFRDRDHTKLTLQAVEMRAIFDPVIDAIIKLTEDRLNAAGHCKRMLLVGGFAGNEYLLKRMRAHFGPRLGGPENVVRPPLPAAAVVKGAVHYGLAPDKFGSRISKLTYGIAQTREWQAGDPEAYVKYVNGSRYCDNSFQIYARAGQEIPVDECVTFMFEPLHENQLTMHLPLVSSPDPNVRYVTDPGVKVEGTMTVQLGDPSRGFQRRVNVSLFFGKTSLEMLATPLNAQDAVAGTLHTQFDTQR